MLVLSRRIDENIVIAGSIRVTVLGICGNRVQLGIVAPLEITVDRAEVHERKQRLDEADIDHQVGLVRNLPSGQRVCTNTETL